MELWRFPWRWGRKKMKVGWRSCGGCCCSDGDEEELMEVRVLVKRSEKRK